MKKASKIVMTAAGLVLIIASVLKSHQLLTEPIISKGFWESWQFFLIQIPLELGLGIWLVCGLFRKAAWLLGVLSFGLFIGVTLQKGLTGAESCGCFGRVHVNPWITFSAMDVPFFVLLLIFRPKGEKLLPPPWPSARHFFGVAIPTFILLPALVLVLAFNKPPEKTDKYEVVKPQEWVKKETVTAKPAIAKPVDHNKPLPQAVAKRADQNQPAQPPIAAQVEEWPMLKHIDIAGSLRSGVVVVLFYHWDCPNCREAIPKYNKICSDLAGGEGSMRFAFVEIPPYGRQEDNPVPPDTSCLKGRLDTSKQWYITTPLVVLIENGSVVKSWEVQAPNLDQIFEAMSAGG
jgi:thiol-disulfide isomerase/thioredoxin